MAGRGGRSGSQSHGSGSQSQGSGSQSQGSGNTSVLNPAVKEVTEEQIDCKCDFCDRSKIDSLMWGPLYQLDGITTHYFCMLFSAGLSQKGEDNEGILGFLPKDIRKELNRGKKLKCKYCKNKHATVGCSVKTCKFSFHYTCGLERGSLFQFIGNYESYCIVHKRKPDIPLDKKLWLCVICYSDVDESDNPMFPPCCNKAVFHRACIMQMAKAAGMHFFKCPLCNNKEKFSEAMRYGGVYVPDSDAAWETEPGAYDGLGVMHNRCDKEPCLCPKGRDYNSKKKESKWKIIRCGGCGAAAIHQMCGGLSNLTYRCTMCSSILIGRSPDSEDDCEGEGEISQNSINRPRGSRISRRMYESSDEDDVRGIENITHKISSASSDEGQESDTESVWSKVSSTKVVPEHVPVFGKPYRAVGVEDDSTDSDDSNYEDEREEDFLAEPSTRTVSMIRTAKKDLNPFKGFKKLYCTGKENSRSQLVGRKRFENFKSSLDKFTKFYAQMIAETKTGDGNDRHVLENRTGLVELTGEKLNYLKNIDGNVRAETSRRLLLDGVQYPFVNSVTKSDDIDNESSDWIPVDPLNRKIIHSSQIKSSKGISACTTSLSTEKMSSLIISQKLVSSTASLDLNKVNEVYNTLFNCKPTRSKNSEGQEKRNNEVSEFDTSLSPKLPSLKSEFQEDEGNETYAALFEDKPSKEQQQPMCWVDCVSLSKETPSGLKITGGKDAIEDHMEFSEVNSPIKASPLKMETNISFGPQVNDTSMPNSMFPQPTSSTNPPINERLQTTIPEINSSSEQSSMSDNITDVQNCVQSRKRFSINSELHSLIDRVNADLHDTAEGELSFHSPPVNVLEPQDSSESAGSPFGEERIIYVDSESGSVTPEPGDTGLSNGLANGFVSEAVVDLMVDLQKGITIRKDIFNKKTDEIETGAKILKKDEEYILLSDSEDECLLLEDSVGPGTKSTPRGDLKDSETATQSSSKSKVPHAEDDDDVIIDYVKGQTASPETKNGETPLHARAEILLATVAQNLSERKAKKKEPRFFSGSTNAGISKALIASSSALKGTCTKSTKIKYIETKTGPDSNCDVVIDLVDSSDEDEGNKAKVSSSDGVQRIAKRQEASSGIALRYFLNEYFIRDEVPHDFWYNSCNIIRRSVSNNAILLSPDKHLPYLPNRDQSNRKREREKTPEIAVVETDIKRQRLSRH